jgi:hypothetical protein
VGAHHLKSHRRPYPLKSIERLKSEGFEPAVVVETSPNNFQSWLNHGQVLDTVTSTRAAKRLAARFGGDPSSVDWRHFGRLVGFTNPKPERQLPSGLRPFARLRSATGVFTRGQRNSLPTSEK